METLAALDSALLARCAPPERFHGRLIALVAGANGLIIMGVLVLLFDLAGEPLGVSVAIGAFGAIWFLNLQRLVLLLHGERRGRWFRLTSRVACGAFLGFFAFLAGFGTIVVLRSRGIFPDLPNAGALVTVLAALFVYPLYARRDLMRWGVYKTLSDESIVRAIAHAESRFVERYERFVRGELGLSAYRVPDAMRVEAAAAIGSRKGRRADGTAS